MEDAYKTFESEEDYNTAIADAIKVEVKKEIQSATSKAKGEILKEMGVKSVKEVKALKALDNDSTKLEKSEEHLELEKELAIANKTISRSENMALAKGKFSDDKLAELAYYKASEATGDSVDFATALDEYVTNNPISEPPPVKTTGVKVTGQSDGEKSGVNTILENKYGIKI